MLIFGLFDLKNIIMGFFICLMIFMCLSKNNFVWKVIDKFRLKYVC